MDASLVIFIAWILLCGYLFYNYGKSAFSSIPKAFADISLDVKSGNFKQRNWHKHVAVGIPSGFVLSMVVWFTKVDWLANAFLSLFVGWWIAWVFEICQAIYLGYSQSKAIAFETLKDVIVSTIAISFGALTFIVLSEIFL